jgi:hypothetical protein
MDTGKTKPAEHIRHLYILSHQVKTYNVYSLVEVKEGKKLILSEKLRIEEYRNKSDAIGITKYLRLRTSTNWNTSEKVTGLRPTDNPRVFYGDRLQKNKKSLLVFIFQKEGSQLYVDVYRSFYPKHKGILQKILKRYEKA